MGDPELIHDTDEVVDILFHSIFNGVNLGLTGSVEIMCRCTISKVEGVLVQARVFKISKATQTRGNCPSRIALRQKATYVFSLAKICGNVCKVARGGDRCRCCGR